MPIRSPSPSAPSGLSLLVCATDPCPRREGLPQAPGRVPTARDGRPPARDPSASSLVRRSNDDNVDAGHRQLANSIRPVGPAPAIATAWSVMVARPCFSAVTSTNAHRVRRSRRKGEESGGSPAAACPQRYLSSDLTALG